MPRWSFFPSANLFIPDGEFFYCQLSNATINNMRPVDTVNGSFIYCQLSDATVNSQRPIDTVNGSFIYCAFDIIDSGFNRIP